MIGMDFCPFLMLLIISIVVSYVIHYVAKIQPMKGFRGYLNKVCVGWIGAWIGAPVFGKWIEPIVVWEVYIIPAIIGSAFAIYLCSTWAEIKKG